MEVLAIQQNYLRDVDEVNVVLVTFNPKKYVLAYPFPPQYCVKSLLHFILQYNTDTYGEFDPLLIPFAHVHKFLKSKMSNVIDKF